MFLGLPFFSFVFFLLDLSNIENGGRLGSFWIVALGRALETIIAQDGGLLKQYRSGLVSLLGGLNESYPFRVCRRGLEAIL